MKLKFLVFLLCYSGILSAQTVVSPLNIVNRNDFGDDLVQFSKGVTVYKEDYKYGIRKANGDWVVKPIYEYISDDLSGDLILFKKDNKYGYMDFSGNVIIPATYKNSSNFKNGYAPVYDNSDESLLIDRTGKTVFKYSGHLSNVGDNGWIPVAPKGSGFKFVDFHGNTKLESSFYFAYGFYKGIAIVATAKDEYCLIDEKGNIKSKHYRTINRAAEGYYIVNGKSGGSFGWLGPEELIDNSGKELLPAIYKSVYAKELPVGIRDSAGKSWFINIETGAPLYNTVYDQISGFIDGAAIVKKNREVYIIDKSGKQVTQKLKGDFDYIDFSGGYARLHRDPYWVLIDRKEQEKNLLPGDVESIVDHLDGTSVFIMNKDGQSKAGIINAQGKIVVEAKYAKYKIFPGGTAAMALTEKGSWECFAPNGKQMFDGKKFGFIDKGDKYFTVLPKNAKNLNELYYMDEWGRKLDVSNANNQPV